MELIFLLFLVLHLAEVAAQTLRNVWHVICGHHRINFGLAHVLAIVNLANFTIAHLFHVNPVIVIVWVVLIHQQHVIHANLHIFIFNWLALLHVLKLTILQIQVNVDPVPLIVWYALLLLVVVFVEMDLTCIKEHVGLAANKVHTSIH